MTKKALLLNKKNLLNVTEVTEQKRTSLRLLLVKM